MPGVTTTQSLRFGYVTDPVDWTMQRNLADDIAVQLDAADVAKAAALGRPAVEVRRNAALALADGSTVLVPMDNEIYDTHNMVDTAGANPSRVTVNASSGTGHYYASGIFTANTTSWSRGEIQLCRNGVIQRSRSLWFPPGGQINVAGIVYLGTVGDYLDLRVNHTGGGTTNATFVLFYVFKLCNA